MNGRHLARGLSLRLAVILMFVSLPCPLPLLAESVFSIVGRVHSEAGTGLPPGAMVRLEGLDGVLFAQQPLGPEGRFEFEGIHKANYHLIATAPGFAPAEKDIDVSSVGDRAFIDLVLLPAAATRKSSSPGPEDDAAPKSARKRFEKGAQALEGKELDKARRFFEEATNLYPCYARAQTSLAVVLILQQNPQPAEQALRKAVACDPAYVDAYFRLGQLLNSQKRFSESVTLLEEPLRRSFWAWQLHYQMAVSRFGLGQYDEAEVEYLRTFSLNPHTPPDLRLELANVYLKERAYGKAYAQMDRYLVEAADSPSAAEVRQTMHKMESSGVLNSGQAESPAPPAKP